MILYVIAAIFIIPALLDAYHSWWIRTGEIVDVEHWRTQGPSELLEWFHGVLGWLFIPIVLVGWFGVDTSSSSLIFDVFVAGIIWVILFVGIFVDRRITYGRRGRKVISAVILHGGRTRNFLFEEPDRYAWEPSLFTALQEKGTLIAWDGAYGKRILALKYPYNGRHVSYGVEEESADEFLDKLKSYPDSPYESVLEELRQMALARQEAERRRIEAIRQRLEAEWRQRERERQALIAMIEKAYHDRWTYPSNSLLLGTFRGHPLDGLIAINNIPQHLAAEYEQHGDYDLPIWFTGEEMGVTVGVTGAGKFTAAVSNNVLLYNGSCFVVDPKGEVCAVTGAARKERHDQKVYRLDPFDATEFTPGTEIPISTYNPLDALNPKRKEFADDVASFVQALSTPRPANSDPYWKDSTTELLTAIIMFVCTHPDAEGNRTLNKVYNYLCSAGLRREWLLEEMGKSKFDAVRLIAETQQDQGEQARKGVWTQARNEVSLFAMDIAKDVTASSSFRLEELFEGRCTLYLVLPPDRLESHSRWLRLMMTISLMMATRYKNNRVVEKRMLWVIDEAAQLGETNFIPRAYELLRGSGVLMWTFWQTLQQIQQTYPKQSDAIIGNSFVQLMSCGDNNTAKYFSEMAAEHEVAKVSTTTTHGTSDTEGYSCNSSVSGGYSYGGGAPSFSVSSSMGGGRSSSTTHSYSVGTTLSKQWEPRIRLHQIFGMPRSKMYLRCPGGLAGLIDKYQYHTNKWLSEIAKPNPYFQAGGRERKLIGRPLLDWNEIHKTPLFEKSPSNYVLLEQPLKKKKEG